MGKDVKMNEEEKEQQRKQDDKLALIVGIFAIAAIILFFIGIWFGWFNNNNKSYITAYPDEIKEQYKDYLATLTLVPKKQGYFQVKLDTNIKWGACVIFLKTNSSDWKKFQQLNLNTEGGYDEQHFIYPEEDLYFTAICCDNKRNCRMSNEAILGII